MLGKLWRTAEEKIQEAMKNGEFENLPGKGKPLDLPAQDPFVPKDRQLLFGMLKSRELVPEEVGLLKELYALRKKLADDPPLADAERVQLKARIRDLELEASIKIERSHGIRL